MHGVVGRGGDLEVVHALAIAHDGGALGDLPDDAGGGAEALAAVAEVAAAHGGGGAARGGGAGARAAGGGGRALTRPLPCAYVEGRGGGEGAIAHVSDAGGDVGCFVGGATIRADRDAIQRVEEAKVAHHGNAHRRIVGAHVPDALARAAEGVGEGGVVEGRAAVIAELANDQRAYVGHERAVGCHIEGHQLKGISGGVPRVTSVSGLLDVGTDAVGVRDDVPRLAITVEGHASREDAQTRGDDAPVSASKYSKAETVGRGLKEIVSGTNSKPPPTPHRQSSGAAFLLREETTLHDTRKAK